MNLGRVFVTTILVAFMLGCSKEPDKRFQQPASTNDIAGCRYVDKTGKPVIDPPFLITDGFDFTEGVAGIKNEHGMLGFIDKKGTVVIPFDFSDGTSFSEELAGVLKNGMCGFINHKGELVIPLVYDTISNFRDGWGTVQRKGAWTFVSPRGQEMKQWFFGTESFSEGLAAAAPIPTGTATGAGSRPQYGFIDKEGDIVIQPGYDAAEPFSNGLAAVLTKGKWGYIDKRGVMVIEAQFDAAGPFSEGLAQIQLGNKMGYVDSRGRIAIEPRFQLDTWQEDPDEKIEMTGKFVGGLACVRFVVGPEANGGWGYIDRTGRFVIPPRYEDADMFAEDLAPVKMKGKWGFVDRKGNLVIPAKFDGVKRFSEGLAFVRGGNSTIH